VFGKFIDCNPGNPSEPHLNIDQIQKDYTEKTKCPIVANFQYGHIPRKLTIPIGLQATLDTKRGRIEVLESAVV
jgi:muramoyltetrapeptide carboxypeptidase